jgi:hypothetical protein
MGNKNSVKELTTFDSFHKTSWREYCLLFCFICIVGFIGSLYYFGESFLAFPYSSTCHLKSWDVSTIEVCKINCSSSHYSDQLCNLIPCDKSNFMNGTWKYVDEIPICCKITDCDEICCENNVCECCQPKMNVICKKHCFTKHRITRNFTTSQYHDVQITQILDIPVEVAPINLPKQPGIEKKDKWNCRIKPELIETRDGGSHVYHGGIYEIFIESVMFGMFMSGFTFFILLLGFLQ